MIKTMNQRAFGSIEVILIVVALLIIGGAWYYETYRPVPTVVSTAVNSAITNMPCDQDYSTSSLSASWTQVVGAWKSIDQNSSFGNEIDFTSHLCGDSYGFRSYYYNAETGVTQPSIWGTWNFMGNGINIIDENDTSSPYIFARFTVSTATLILYSGDGSKEGYSRIPN